MSTDMLSLTQRIEESIGKKSDNVHEVMRGYTPAKRLVISFEDGSSIFAKIGTTADTSGWLRKEHRLYEALSGSFMPNYLGWNNDSKHPILLLEDLSKACWPFSDSIPWTEEQIDLVLSALDRLWGSTLRDIPRLTDFGYMLDGWHQVAADPEPFLALNLVSESWLNTALQTLLEIDGQEVAKGNSLLHLDIRSDNICIDGFRAILVDWNHVCRGNKQCDLGFWLPSLHAEGGPPPESFLPDGAEIAGLISGFFAVRAGLPLIPDAPKVRTIQLVQLRYALPWAVRALDLPPLDGRKA